MPWCVPTGTPDTITPLLPHRLFLLAPTPFPARHRGFAFLAAAYAPFTVLACLPFTLAGKLETRAPALWTVAFCPLWIACTLHVLSRAVFFKGQPRAQLLNVCVFSSSPTPQCVCILVRAW